MAKENDVDQYTAQIVPDAKTTVSGQYFDLNQPFAFPRYGNECNSYINGRDYMKAVAGAIRSAKSFIFIADWQLDYDVELDNRGDPKHPGRLSELLADALQRGVHIRVLCYDSIRYALDTHDDSTQKKLNDLPKGKGSIRVMLQNPNTARRSAIREGVQKGFGLFGKMDPNVNFSHHQKFVVIDGNEVFMGGIDLAYGRWETPAYNVIVDPKINVLNDGYNMQVDAGRDPTAEESALTKEQADKRPGFAESYYADGKLLDPATQPREPWNDVAVGIKGPAAYDVFVNFVLRWNSFAHSGTNAFDSPLYTNWFEGKAKGHKTLIDPLQNGKGQASVQICRSASSAQLSDELSLWDGKKYIHDDWKQPKPERRKIIEAARKSWAGDHQTSIYDAMLNSIQSAQAFIYIENQFFISDCGSDRHGTKSPASNEIIKELANAVGKAIYAGRPFHVWLVLPEHPEGKLEEKGTSAQAWWALQGIKHSNNSLINRINAGLVKKNSKAWGVENAFNAKGEVNLDVVNQSLAKNGKVNEWKKYLTILNVRNYGQTSKGVLTEMIYVHSKLMIVDDAVAIIGSANINDRSLSGNGDTELAAVIVDDAEAESIDVGQNVVAPVRKFARDLRIKLWKKNFGMLIDTPTTGVQKENDAPLGIDLKRPLALTSINGIQTLASANREAYNSVFTHTPRNTFGGLQDGRKKYPVITKKVKKYSGVAHVSDDGIMVNDSAYELVDEPTSKNDFSKLPSLQPTYMNNGKHDIAKAIEKLRASVKGFIVEMPLDWGNKETKTPPPPANMPAMIAHNQPRSASEVANV